MANPTAKSRRPDSSELNRCFEAACRQNPEAIEQLLTLYRPLMLKLANQQLGLAIRPKVAPSDLVQVALMKAAQSFGEETFAARSNFVAWLKTILSNEAANAGRRFRQAQKRDITREQSLSNPETLAWLQQLSASLSQSELGGASVRQRVEDVMQALATLPPHYQLTLRLRYFEKLRFEAISRKLERSPDAVRVLHNRAIRSLRDKLQSKTIPAGGSNPTGASAKGRQ